LFIPSLVYASVSSKQTTQITVITFYFFSSLFFRAGSFATVRNSDTANTPKMIHSELLEMFFQVSLSG